MEDVFLLGCVRMHKFKNPDIMKDEGKRNFEMNRHAEFSQGM